MTYYKQQIFFFFLNNCVLAQYAASPQIQVPVGAPMQPGVVQMVRPVAVAPAPGLPAAPMQPVPAQPVVQSQPIAGVPVAAMQPSSNTNVPNPAALPLHMQKYDWQTPIEKQVIDKEFVRKPPNKESILFLRLPKSGSTSFRALMNQLSKKSLFNLEDDHEQKTETMDNYVIDVYKRSPSRFFSLSRTFFMKYHYWLNVTQASDSEFRQPTIISFMREPVDWFGSKYYSCRFGFNRNPEPTGNCKKMILPKIEMSLEECINQQEDECNFNTYEFIEYYCGKYDECQVTGPGISDEQKRKAVDIAKRRILEDFHFVGIMEYFEWSLLLLEFYLPYYIGAGVQEYNRNGAVREGFTASRTIKKSSISEEARIYLETTVLKHEKDLYDFTKNLFFERLIRSGAVNPEWYQDEDKNRFQTKLTTGKWPEDPAFLKKYVPLRLHHDMTIEFYKFKSVEEGGTGFHTKMEEMLDADANKPPPTMRPLPKWSNLQGRQKNEAELLKAQQQQLLQQIDVMQQLKDQQEGNLAKKAEIEEKQEEARRLQQEQVRQAVAEQKKLEAEERAKAQEAHQEQLRREAAAKAGWGGIVAENEGGGQEENARPTRHEFR